MGHLLHGRNYSFHGMITDWTCLVSSWHKVFLSISSAWQQASIVTSKAQAQAMYTSAKAVGRVAFDCEGRRLSKTGQLCLVQVSLHASHTCI